MIVASYVFLTSFGFWFFIESRWISGCAINGSWSNIHIWSWVERPDVDLYITCNDRSLVRLVSRFSGKAHSSCIASMPTSKIWLRFYGRHIDKFVIQLLLSASDDKRLILHDVRTSASGKPGSGAVASLSGHSSWVLSTDISPDGRLALSGYVITFRSLNLSLAAHDGFKVCGQNHKSMGFISACCSLHDSRYRESMVCVMATTSIVLPDLLVHSWAAGKTAVSDGGEVLGPADPVTLFRTKNKTKQKTENANFLGFGNIILANACVLYNCEKGRKIDVNYDKGMCACPCVWRSVMEINHWVG